MNTMNNEISSLATDMNNMASDTSQAGTGIGQSSPHIDLNASKEDYAANTTSSNKWLSDPDFMKETAEQNDKLIEDRKWNEKTHGDIMSDVQKYEAEIDKINEVQELFRNNKITEAMKLANQLGFNINDYIENQGKLEDGFKFEDIAELIDPRKSELLNLIKDLKSHDSFDNRTDEQKREDKLLADQREREDTVAQRGTQDMLKAGLHPASANYGGSIGGSSGGGGGGGSSESEKEKERRRRRKKYLEEKRREREREKRQNVMKLLATMGSAATFGALRNIPMGTKNMNKPTTKNTGAKKWNNKEFFGEEIIINNENYNNWRKESKSNAEKYFAAVEKLDTKLPRDEWNRKINELKDKYNM